MEALVTATNETATLSIRNGWHRTYIDQVTPDRDVKMEVQLGRSVPLHAGASSKAFLAFLRPTDIDRFFTEVALDPLTDATVTNERALRRELGGVRERGYALSLGERLQGAGSVAAPILGHEGTPLAVMSVSGPIERFRGEIDDAAKALMEATARVSRQVGHSAAS
jgi:DNA-binding IclR family transcriptional regulator